MSTKLQIITNADFILHSKVARQSMVLIARLDLTDLIEAGPTNLVSNDRMSKTLINHYITAIQSCVMKDTQT